MEVEAARVVFRDAAGRAIELDETPRRIASLGPSITEILFALGAGQRLVGRDRYSDFPPEARSVPSMGSTHPRLSPEPIVALEPDLILAAGSTSTADVWALARLGLTVYSVTEAARFEDVYENIRAIGRLTDREEASEELLRAMQSRVWNALARVHSVEKRPRVFYQLDPGDGDKPWTAGRGTLIDELLTLGGGRNVGRRGKDPYFQMSLEEIVVSDPQVIIIGSDGTTGRADILQDRPGWRGVSAVKEGAVFYLDKDLVVRPGPRIVEGLEQISRLLHPEVFR